MDDIISRDKVVELAKAAEAGDVGALKELKALNRRYAGIFNKRYARAQAAGLPTAAMEKVLRWDAGDTLAATKAGKLSTGSLGGDPYALGRQITGVANILRAGKTLAVYREEWQAGIDALATAFPEVAEMGESQKQALREVFRSRAFRELIKLDSDRIIHQAIQMIQKGATGSTFRGAYRRWQEDQRLYAGDAWHDLVRKWEV